VMKVGKNKSVFFISYANHTLSNTVKRMDNSICTTMGQLEHFQKDELHRSFVQMSL
jgi:hypothetical protein